jgi:hypothetical protein
MSIGSSPLSSFPISGDKRVETVGRGGNAAPLPFLESLFGATVIVDQPQVLLPDPVNLEDGDDGQDYGFVYTITEAAAVVEELPAVSLPDSFDEEDREFGFVQSAVEDPDLLAVATVEFFDDTGDIDLSFYTDFQSALEEPVADILQSAFDAVVDDDVEFDYTVLWSGADEFVAPILFFETAEIEFDELLVEGFTYQFIADDEPAVSVTDFFGFEVEEEQPVELLVWTFSPPEVIEDFPLPFSLYAPHEVEPEEAELADIFFGHVHSNVNLVNSDRRAQVAWAELEVPDLSSSAGEQRRGWWWWYE